MSTCGKKKDQISRIFRTDCQKKELLFVRTSTCTRGKTHVPLDLFAKDTACTRGKTHVPLDLFAKDTACTRGKTHVGLLLDKDTAVALMYNVNMHVRGHSCTFGSDSYRLTKDKAHV